MKDDYDYVETMIYSIEMYPVEIQKEIFLILIFKKKLFNKYNF